MRLTKEEKQYLQNSVEEHIKNVAQVRVYSKSQYKAFKSVCYWRLTRDMNKRIKWLSKLLNKIKGV